MIKRDSLLTAISKYHLSGNVEKVVWNVDSKTLFCKFIDESKTLVGEVKCPLDIKDGSYCIYDTNSLSKMISILDHDVHIETVGNKEKTTQMLLADSKVDIKYNLADKRVIPTPPEVSGLDTIAFEMNLDSEFTQKFIKAKDSLSAINVVNIGTHHGFTGEQALISVGDRGSSTIEFHENANVNENVRDLIPFNSDLIKDIFRANKTFKQGTLALNPKGLLIIKFVEDDITSKYYLVRNQNN